MSDARPSRWLPGLRGQVLLAATAAVLVVVLASAVTAAWYFVERQHQAQHSRALAIADALALQLERILSLGIPVHDLQGFDVQCDEALARHDGLSFAMVTDLQGQLLFRSARGGRPLPALSPQRGKVPRSADLDMDDGAEHLVLSPVHDAAGAPVAMVGVAFPTALLDAERNSLLLRVAAVGAAGLVLVLGLLWLGLSRVLIAPLQQVVQAVSRMRDGHPQPQATLPEGAPRELQLLAEGFNGLMHRVSLRESELLAARDAAQRANQAKSQFLAMMSHELRTPLNAVLGMAELLGRTPLDPRQQRLLGQMRSSGRLLADIIADLLDLSAIEAGRLRVAASPFRLRDTVTESVESFRAEAERRGLWLTLDLDPALPERLLGDAPRVQQVLGNLLSNALKFTERGGVRVTVSPNGAAVRVAVADTGVGIDDEFLPHIYEAFRQADGSMSRRFGGSGLGLSISRALCDAMQGRIDLATRPGRGTTVWFELPMRLPEAGASAVTDAADATPAGAGVPAPVVPLRPVDVLLVEDDAINRELVLQCLADARWRVAVAREGVEGLARIYDRRYDVVLLDWQLPGIDGESLLQALRALEARERWPHTPVIVLTAHASTQQRQACLQAGVDAFVAKPYTCGELDAALEQVLAPAVERPRQPG